MSSHAPESMPYGVTHYLPNHDEHGEEHRVVSDGSCWCRPTAHMHVGALHEIMIYVHNSGADVKYAEEIASWIQRGRNIAGLGDDDPDGDRLRRRRLSWP